MLSFPSPRWWCVPLLCAVTTTSSLLDGATSAIGHERVAPDTLEDAEARTDFELVSGYSHANSVDRQWQLFDEQLRLQPPGFQPMLLPRLPNGGPHRRLSGFPGEFERQQFLVLSCGLLTPDYADTIVNVVQAVRRHVAVILLCSDAEQRQIIVEVLRTRLDSLENILLLEIPHDTKWVRDYGPTLVRTSGGSGRMIDWCYEQARVQDDQVPQLMAASSQLPLESSQAILEGGNLLSNGDGLIITTDTVLDANTHLSEAQFDRELRQRLNATEVVILEPLINEPTGHVDMFATFVTPNRVLIGEYSPNEDPMNAALLDRNAARLAAVITSHGPMHVDRIPMGVNDDGLWRTYTNCVYANGVVLVPSYRSRDYNRLHRAITLYRQLLPQWQVLPIDASVLIEDSGSLHCATLNIPLLQKPIQPIIPPTVPAESKPAFLFAN